MKIILVVLFSLLGCALGGRHSPAEIFNGALYFVNGSQIVNGVSVPTRDPSLGPLLGNIMYAPAYPGALFGNMSVVFGNKQGTNATDQALLSLISAYTGPYTVFPDADPPYVLHHPIISNNPVSGHTAQDVDAKRYYRTYEDDNLVEVISTVPTNSSLMWRRDFPFPPAPTCLLAASVTATGNSWSADGVTHQQYTLTVRNAGESRISSADVTLNLGGTQTITSSWNLRLESGSTYSVALYSGLAPGDSSSAAGFITAGAGTVTVAVPPSSTVCN
eukprot:Phypoly_transcript_13437.p1 GENE.Phypoly_transcript_13437~~Phypoly_transcript_13437.p1  ORF type:complete len:275 (+),score=47.23 Phypoly_transcript_13437:237-1061(+)